MDIYAIMDHPKDQYVRYSYYKLIKRKSGYWWQHCRWLWSGKSEPKKPKGIILNKRLPFIRASYIKLDENFLDES